MLTSEKEGKEGEPEGRETAEGHRDLTIISREAWSNHGRWALGKGQGRK